MPPKPKVKGKKRNGAAPTPQPSENNKGTQVFIDGEESLTDDEVSFPGQGSLNQQMSHTMDLLSDLSNRVTLAEIQKSPREESPSVSPSTWTTAS